MRMNLGRWTDKQLDQLLQEASGMPDVSARIAFVSGQFLGVSYQDDTLIGAPDRDEELVINLAAVDCFTFIDYVEAMRRSRSFDEFLANLKAVRYREGHVSYKTRNHFFTDWIECNSGLIKDVTPAVEDGSAQVVRKTLNRKKDGTLYLPGIPEAVRDVAFIPDVCVTDAVLGRLMTGDYLGIYSTDQGLDVTHVGIAIKGRDVFLRHASSDANMRRVVDSPLEEYLSGKPGIIVLRPTG